MGQLVTMNDLRKMERELYRQDEFGAICVACHSVHPKKDIQCHCDNDD